MAKNLSHSTTKNGEKFIWEGTYENLKKLLGTWTSSGGEIKLFTSPLVCLKWQSKTSEWITLSGNEADDVAKQLRSICDEVLQNFLVLKVPRVCLTN